jgi:hypothetical protein
MTDTGMFILETTMNNYNETSTELIQFKSLNTWLRAIHSTWTATSAKDWCVRFIRDQSGTYNHQ